MPYAGSYEDLGLRQTFATAQARYAPYGFGENTTETIDWNRVDWAELQNECFSRNVRADISRADMRAISLARKMTLPSPGSHTNTSPRPKTTTGRTAILIRGFTGYDFKPQDLWSIRALITETSLRSGARYSVYLLVDVKGNLDVWRSAAKHRQVLMQIPVEFRNMVVLFDQEHLLKAWYPKVGDHR